MAKRFRGRNIPGAMIQGNRGIYANEYELAAHFGRKIGHHLPDEHLEKEVQGIRLVLLTKKEAEARGNFHRVFQQCLFCNQLIPGGRMHQHVPICITKNAECFYCLGKIKLEDKIEVRKKSVAHVICIPPMTATPHSGQCDENSTQALELIAIWEKQWPNYHRACQGNGVFVFYESHGFRGGGREMLQDPCTCTEDGKCARCGAVGLTEDGEGPCRFCGWNYDDARPQEWECYGDCAEIPELW